MVAGSNPVTPTTENQPLAKICRWLILFTGTQMEHKWNTKSFLSSILSLGVKFLDAELLPWWQHVFVMSESFIFLSLITLPRVEASLLSIYLGGRS